MRKKWQDDFKKFVAPPRPATIFDERYDALNTQIQQLRKEQPKTLRRKKQIEDEIQTLENELEKVKERRTAQDNLWTELQWIESANRVIGRRT
jgi:chromosome segregation ATPase